MKRHLIRAASLLMCGMLLLALGACGKSASQGDLLSRIKDKGELIIATEGDWAPWTYHDESDALVGLDVELGKLIADGLGVKAVFQETDWDSILTGVKSGRFDIACNGVGYTEKRAEDYNFTQTYIYTQMGLVVRSDNSDILTVNDLAGKTTANSPSSTYAEIAEQYGATVSFVNTIQETMTLLEQGRVDATINSMESIQDYLIQHPEAKVKVVQVLPGEEMVIPARKDADTQSLIRAINEILDAARKDGRLRDLSEKYFHLDLTQPAN